jgi:hypothetical protein
MREYRATILIAEVTLAGYVPAPAPAATEMIAAPNGRNDLLNATEGWP